MSKHYFCAIFTAALIPAWTSSALATAPAVRVNNEVTVSYTVESLSQVDATAAAGFVIDRKIDMQVIRNGVIGDARPNQDNRRLVFRVLNEGNDVQAFDIDVLRTGTLATKLAIDNGTDALTEGEYRVYISDDDTLDGGDSVYDPGNSGDLSIADTPAAYDDNTVLDEFHVIIDIYVPDDAANDEVVTFTVVATALANATTVLVESLGAGLDDAVTPSNVVDIVFADSASTANAPAADANEDGKHTDASTLTVASAELTATKTVTIVNDDLNLATPFNCATDADPGTLDDDQGAIPGGCVEYTITVENGAGANQDAGDVSISDPIPTDLTFSGFFGDVSAWATIAENAGTVTGTLTDPLAPGESVVLRIRAVVN